jgi:hypothetical protein
MSFRGKGAVPLHCAARREAIIVKERLHVQRSKQRDLLPEKEVLDEVTNESVCETGVMRINHRPDERAITRNLALSATQAGMASEDGLVPKAWWIG